MKINLLLCLLLIVLNLSMLSQSKVDAGQLALVGGRIITSPDSSIIDNGTILIKDGRITQIDETGKLTIPIGVTKIDCKGTTITAGFWNSHVHFSEEKWNNAAKLPPEKLEQQLQDMLSRYGFTTVFDTGSFLENTLAIRTQIEKGIIKGPKIKTVGTPIAPKNGTPIYLKPIQLPEAETPAQALIVVKEQLKAGADGVKIFAGSFLGVGKTETMLLDVVKSISLETHRQGKYLLAHPQTYQGIKVAIDGGVDVLLHTAPEAGEFDEKLLSEMKRARIALVPTLKLWKFVAQQSGAKEEFGEKFQNGGIVQLKAFANADGRVLFGTDIGFMTDYDPTEEYLAMSKAGLDFRKILASLTSNPAEQFGEPLKGKIAIGANADLVILAGNPDSDLTTLTNVRYTIRDGQVIYKATVK